MSRFQVADYVDVIEDGRDDFERYRMIVHDLPRRFHAASREDQALALESPPALPGTHWDASLAATAEHIAILHDQSIPD